MAVKRIPKRWKHIEDDIGHKLSSTQRNGLNWAMYMTTLEGRVKHRTKNRLYKLANPEKDTLYHKKRNQKNKYQVLLAYSKGKEPSCSCCGLNNLDFLTLDHIDGSGAKDRKDSIRKREGRNIYGKLLTEYKKTGLYPSGYKTMCMNCNWVKHLRGTCDIKYHTVSTVEVILDGS